MRKRKLLACLLTVGMLMSLIPSAVAVETTAEKPNNHPAAVTDRSGVQLEKWATLFDKDKNTDITLKVTAPEKEAVAIEFVLDATTSLWTNDDATLTTLDQWVQQVKAGLDKHTGVYVGVTMFGSEANTIKSMTQYSNSSFAYNSAELAQWLTKHFGTNVQAGIQAGLKDLEKAPATAEKYMVLVTDGGSYCYTNANDQLINTGNEAAEVSNRDNVHAWNELVANSALAATNFEKAILAAKAAVDQVKAQNINLITVGYPYYPNDTGLVKLNALAAAFVEYSASVSASQGMYGKLLQNKSETDTAEAIKSALASIYRVVPAQSKITDIVGTGTDNLGAAYDFDYIAKTEITLDFAGNKMTATLGTDNKATFSKNGVTYAYLEYKPADTNTKEQFILTLAQDLLSKDTLTLTYKAKLTNPSSVKGTHIVDTNVEATLAPYDPVKKEFVDPIKFPEPSLSYTVSGGGGGGGGNKPVLNKEDHFGYIIGYPVDYYTGEPTTDQTKKPVRPQGNITRAEVATIFFRMLTDESRTEFWSQTNDYSDVKQGQWFNPAISTLSNAGIISGYPDGTFKPNGYITRAEFATIAVRFFEVQYDGKDLFPDISTHWAKDYINQAGSAGLVNGYPDGTFGPNKNITRAEAVTLVNRTLDRHPDQEHFLSDMLVWPDNMDTTKWYYADMQEATNSHEYEMKTASDGTKYEIWTKMLPIRDWEAFEKAWSDANSATNPGEVVNKPSTSK